jgi:hypothetical protein
MHRCLPKAQLACAITATIFVAVVDVCASLIVTRQDHPRKPIDEPDLRKVQQLNVRADGLMAHSVGFLKTRMHASPS